MSNIEHYVDSIVNRLALSKLEREDYRIQFIDHINSLKEEYLEKGYSEAYANEYAIKDFGNNNLIRKEIDNKPVIQNRQILTIVRICFIIYVIFLMVILVNPIRHGNMDAISYARQNGGWFEVTLNIIPFKTILYYISHINKINNGIVILNLLGKILLFIPWGILVPITFSKTQNLRDFVGITILFISIVQVVRIIFPIGIADVDNIILYTIGSVVGFMILKLIKNNRFK